MGKKQQKAQQSVSLWTWVIVAGLAVSISLGAFLVSRGSPEPKASAQKLTMPDHVPPQPDWLKSALQPVREAYIYAASNHDKLQYIPCYCGCGPGHINNSECYFRRDPNGNVIDYEQHAYG